MTHPRHDTHAIPAADEPEPAANQKYLPGDWIDITLRCAKVLGVGATEDLPMVVIGHDAMSDVVKVALTDDILVAFRAKANTPLPIVVEPARTHGLSVRREFGNVIVRAEAGLGSRVVYLQDGVAHDLGRVLAALTPAQRQVLIDDLTGGVS